MIRKPDWLKTNLPNSIEYSKLKSKLRNFNTICVESDCPNIFDCWQRKTSTFLILGKICTRNCLYCNVRNGKPDKIDNDEPKRIKKLAKELNLRYVVITSVTRDDMPDFGASQFIKTLNELKKINCKVELLIPDFNGDYKILKKIVDNKPDVLAHNIEVVSRFFKMLRPNGNYKRSLKLLETIKKIDKNQISKSGFMVGFGEDKIDIIKTMNDLKKAGVDIITIGQYLMPSLKHFPVIKYYHPIEFKKFEEIGKKMGFKQIFSGPLIRSSYKAEESYFLFKK